jgi:hypothetical protein
MNDAVHHSMSFPQQLDDHFDAICRNMTSGKLLDDIGWFGKIHAESVMRKDRGELT